MQRATPHLVSFQFCNFAADMAGMVADCGESRRVSLDSTMTHVGTPIYAAPEILRGERYDQSADLYSFGVVISEVKARAQPFIEVPKSEKTGFNCKLIKDIKKGKRRVRNDKCWGEKICDLIDRCTRLARKERPTFAEISVVLRDLYNAEDEGDKKEGVQG